MDFTIKKYIELLDALIQAGYSFQTFTEFIKAPEKKSIILRHDVMTSLVTTYTKRCEYHNSVYEYVINGPL